MKKAYKVFEPEWTCRDYDFKDKNGNAVGTTHKIEGQIRICDHGFHYCPKLVNCFNYYGFNSNNKVAEIEVLGEFKSDDDGKEVTNEFKILRELTWFEVLELVNIGIKNTGRANTGDRNTGHQNTGYQNTGHWNTGHWNTGDQNTGHFNTITPETILVFNKECSRKVWNNTTKPDFIYFNYLTKFIWSSDMTDEEKIKHPEHECLGGYLREMTYKEAFKYSWENADKEDRKLVLELPNFDNEIFKEISGIDVLKELKKNCHMGGINESIQ